MKMTNSKIESVVKGSLGEEVGIEKGDIILSINDNTISDILEYKFLVNDEYLNIILQKANGEEWEIEIEKEYDEDLGIIFENSLMDEAKSCKNKCIFCFIDQLPPNMRETLYFKDDDSRLSFLQGNYITLTNLNDIDIQKIIRYKISPLNISVHTTDPDLRVKMINNKHAGNIIETLKRLARGGIVLNCQIVLCRHVNDGDNLNKTIEDLASLYPALKSVSIVPVGLTKYRKGLYELQPFDKQSSRQVIEQVEKWQKTFKRKYKTNLIYLADEFYIMSDKNIPEYKEYEDFPQIENGVGLIALFKKEFNDYFRYLNKTSIKISENRTVSLVTGQSSYEFIKGLCNELEKKYSNLKINVYKITNYFFGENVTVTGLITGTDILSQLKGKQLGEQLIIPECSLRSGENVFLDDITINDLEKELKIEVQTCPNNGKKFIKCILGR